MTRIFLFLLTGFAFTVPRVCGQVAHISGRLNPDSGWSRIVYVSRIPDFNQMFTASDKLIVAQAALDSTGDFNVSFPADTAEGLFRLHLVKKEDPVSTLIIGNEEENHVFFVAKNGSRVFFTANTEGKFMLQQNIKGDESNEELNRLLKLNGEVINRDSLKTQLISTAQNSKSELVGLLAIYSGFGLSADQKQEVSRLLRHYDKSNSYGGKIFEEYASTGTRTLILLGFVFVISCLLLYNWNKKRTVKKISQSLSVRETKIVQQILEGKSNKEIAADLNIELSTVKTHVNNIYTKLKVRNRKDILKYKDLFYAKNNS